MKHLAGLALTFSCALAQSYPPAQGPPVPPPSDHPVELQIRLLVDASVRDLLQKKLNGPLPFPEKSINQQLAERSDVHAKVRASDVHSWQPYMTQTQYPDRPNSRYLLMPYMIELMVEDIKYNLGGLWIPYPWDRKIIVSTEIGVYCDHWETGKGEVKIVSRSNPPYLDSDPSFSEQLVNAFLGNWLIPLVDSRVRQGLQGIGPSVTGTGFSCNYLDFAPGDPGDLRQGLLRFEQKSTRILFRPPITVRLLEITRLTVHDIYGSPVYEPVETPNLFFYANFSGVGYTLPPVTEGQTVSLSSLQPLSVPLPTPAGLLVLIAT